MITLRHAVSVRHTPAPEGRLELLAHVVGWVRDQNPSSRPAEGASPGGKGVGPEVLAACDGFGRDWTETLTAVQARTWRTCAVGLAATAAFCVHKPLRT